MKRQAMVGPNFKRMDRSPEKSASITVTIQPSRLADGEFFSSLLRGIPRFNPAETCSNFAIAPSWHVRQLGEIDRHAAGLVVGEPVGRRSDAWCDAAKCLQLGELRK
jgi:hypothetical protein